MFNSKMLEILNNLVIIFPALIIIFTLKGFGKAFSANLFGDNTAKKYGFLSLNPLNHLDLIGLMLTLFIIFIFAILFSPLVPTYYSFILVILFAYRWSYDIPINEMNFKYYSLGVLSTIISGPLFNFLGAFLLLVLSLYLPINLLPKYAYTSLVMLLRTAIEFCVFFGVLDLIPLPPFSGGRVLRVIFPLRFHGVIDWLDKYSLFILLALFLLPGLSNYFFGTIYAISFSIKMLLLKIVFKI